MFHTKKHTIVPDNNVLNESITPIKLFKIKQTLIHNELRMFLKTNKRKYYFIYKSILTVH